MRDKMDNQFNAFSKVRPCGMCEWTVESLYKDMATWRTAGEDKIDRSTFPCEMLYTAAGIKEKWGIEV